MSFADGWHGTDRQYENDEKRFGNNSKEYLVEVTEQGSEKGLPAIWYGGLAGEILRVVKSKMYHRMYEVVDGKYAGRIIEFKSVKILTHE